MYASCSRTAAVVTIARRTLSRSARARTWVFHRVLNPTPTTPGGVQRHPEELPHTQRIRELGPYETDTPAEPIKVILLQDVEGVGHQFDVVSVERERARNELLLPRLAVYASPFDLDYYARKKEEMAAELAARIRIPYEQLLVGRRLLKLLLPVRVNMESPWTIDPALLATSLRYAGVELPDESVRWPTDSPVIKGPSFENEGRLIRFYVVIGHQYVIPMVGRIQHISGDESKQLTSAAEGGASRGSILTDGELAKWGLRPLAPYFHKTNELTVDGPDVSKLVDKHNFGA